MQHAIEAVEFKRVELFRHGPLLTSARMLLLVCFHFQVDYITRMTGMHEFAEFSASDVGTIDSGLNSIVVANNNEMVSMWNCVLQPNRHARRRVLGPKTDCVWSRLDVLSLRSGVSGQPVATSFLVQVCHHVGSREFVEGVLPK